MRTSAVWRSCDGEGPRKGTYPVALACWSLSLPCFLHPHSRAPMLHRGCAPAPTLQSTQSTQRTQSNAHTPERPLCTEDAVQCPHPRSPTLHRGRGPAPTPQITHSAQRMWSSAHTPEHPFYTEDAVQSRSLLGLLPVLHRGSTHHLPTASPRTPPSSCFKSHNASCSEASPTEILEGILCPSGTDACLVMGAVMSPRVRVQPGAQTGGLRPRETVGVSHGPSLSQAES